MNGIIQIKQAMEKDITAIGEIYLDVVNHFGVWSKERVSWEGLSKEFSIADFHIAYIDDKPVACVALQDHAPFYWYEPVEKGEALFLRRLAVKRCAAGKNFSRYLLDYAVNECHRKSIKTLRLDFDTNNEKLKKIYESFGFVCKKQEIKVIGGSDYHISYYVYYIE